MSQRGKSLGAERDARIEAAKKSAHEKRAAMGLEPVAPENLEYEAQAAERARRRRRKKR